MAEREKYSLCGRPSVEVCAVAALPLGGRLVAVVEGGSHPCEVPRTAAAA
eukprot:CAMPEP_0119143594 /NCGR_PEP_ID=MMETSP1310-20130426/34592_1 /TAXON_ID=464262 /ORGANISM="Genus nov. species nov., Strain RCC2339" /LENGTH=49 /DNA_ID= /DNA_START= /DNA_END= /DNA_ORIENTATION=